MSAFCVFGVALKHCVDRARRTVSTRKDGKNLTPEEWEEAVQANAAELMDKAKAKAVSDKFDAPQSASDFIALARKDGRFRDLHIRSYQDTKRKNKKTGKPIFKWLPA